MSNSLQIKNLSIRVNATVITSGTTNLTNFDNSMYQVNAVAGNVTINLPPMPSTSNSVTCGSLFFQRIDLASVTNTVNVVWNDGVISLSLLLTSRTSFYWFMLAQDELGNFKIYQFSLMNFDSVPIIGGTMQGSINSSSYVIKTADVVDLTSTSKDAVNYKTLLSTLNNYLAKSGGTMTGSIDSSSYVVKVANPVDITSTSKDAVNYGTLLSATSSITNNAINQLTGGVTTGTVTNGSAVATVQNVGGATAANIASSVTTVQNATPANTNSTLMQRSSTGSAALNELTANAVYLNSNASLGNQAPTWSQVQGYVAQSRVNIQSVATISLVNQNSISTASFIGVTINGRVLAAGDRIALIGQNTAVDNGIYYVDNGTGHLLRTADCASGIDGNGFVFGVLYGTYANYFYRISPTSPATTCIFGTDTPTYTIYFIIQNLVADNTTTAITGNTISVKASGIGTTQLAPYTTGGLVMGTDATTKKPIETSVTTARLSQLFTSTASAIQVSNFGSDTLGNGWTIPYATLSTALTNATGAGVINLVGGFGATGTFTQSQDNQQIQGIGCDGSQIANITGTITAPSGRTRLKLKDITLTGTSTNVTPYICASGNLGRNYFKNVTFIPYTTNPSINISAAIQNWHVFDDCDFQNLISINGAVGTGETYTFTRARGAVYLSLNKNVPVTFVDCPAVFVVAHTAGQIGVYGRTTVNIVSTATLASGALIYLENCSTYNPATQAYGSISSVCTTILNNVTRQASSDSIAALTTISSPVKPATAASGSYVTGINADGVLTYATLPSVSLMTAATDSAAGTSGTVPAPQQYANNLFLKGDATWSPLVPNWTANKIYPEGAIVAQTPFGQAAGSGVSIFRRKSGAGAGSAAGWTSAEQSNWDNLSTSTSGIVNPKASVANTVRTLMINAWNTLVFDSVTLDNFGSYNPSTGEYTIQVDGTYQISAMITPEDNQGYQLNDYGIQVCVNGIAVRQIARMQLTPSQNMEVVSGTTILPLVKNNKVTLQIAATNSTYLQANVPDRNWFCIHRLADYDFGGGSISSLPPLTNNSVVYTDSTGNLTSQAISGYNSSNTNYDVSYDITTNKLVYKSNVFGRNMQAASSSAAGLGGLVPNPQQYANSYYLRGDATWAPIFQAWQANAIYPEQSVVIQTPIGSTQSTIFFRKIGSGAGASATWDATEQNKWLQLGSGASGGGSSTTPTNICLLSGSSLGNVTNANSLINFPSTAINYISYDPSGMHSGTVNTSRITITTAGIYKIKAMAEISYSVNTGNLTSYFMLMCYVNNTIKTMSYGTGALGHSPTANIFAVLNLNVGDYVELRTVTDATNAMPINYASFGVELASNSAAGSVISTTLTSAMTATDTTANVTSTAGFLSSGYITIDSELMLYTNTSSTSFIGLTRGTNGTTATTHNNSSKVNFVTYAIPALTTGRVLVSDNLGVASASSVTSTTLGYLDVTSSIQTKLNNKLNLSGGTLTGALTLASDPTANLQAATKQYVDNKSNAAISTTLTSAMTATDTTANVTSTAGFLSSGYLLIDSELISYTGKTSTSFTGLTRGSSGTTAATHNNAAKVGFISSSGGISPVTASRVLVSDSSGNVAASSVSTTTLGYLDATSSIQTQLNDKLSLTTGGTVAGTVQLNAIPVNGLDAVNKTYVDTAISGYVPSAKTITSANSPYQVVLSDNIINIDASSGSIVINLPPVAGVANATLSKRYSFNRVDTSTNLVLMNTSSVTPTDSILGTPSNTTQINILPITSFGLIPVFKANASLWILSNNDTLLNYGGMPWVNLITASSTITRHGNIYTINATSDITITVPNCLWGIGSTLFYRIDKNTQWKVTIAPVTGQTIEGSASYLMPANSKIRVRTVSTNDTDAKVETLFSSDPYMTVSTGCTYQFINNGTIAANTAALNSISFNGTNQTSYDPSNMHSNTINPSKFFAKVGGIYDIRAMVALSGTSQTGFGILGILVNGNEPASLARDVRPVVAYFNGAGFVSLELEYTVSLNAGDSIEIAAFQSSAATMTIQQAKITMALAQNALGFGNQPAAICQISMSGTIGTFQKEQFIPFPSIAAGFTKYDPLGMHNPAVNTTRITIQTSGVYELVSYIKYADATGMQSSAVRIWKNGVTVLTDNWEAISANNQITNKCVFYASLVAGDFIEIQSTWQGTPTTLTLQYAAFSAKLGQGVPTNLPTIGSAGQVLTVNALGNGLQYSTVATNAITGACLARRNLNTQTLATGVDTIILFDATDTDFDNGIATGITYNNGTFTNSSNTRITVAISYTICFGVNGTGVRYAWLELSSTSQAQSYQKRIAQTGCIPISNDGTPLSTSATLSLAANETVVLKGWQTSGGNLGVNTGAAGMAVGYGVKIQFTRII